MIPSKGKVQQKITINSLSTHHCADGGVGEVFESTKHFWSVNSVAAKSSTIEVNGDHLFKLKKKNKTEQKQKMHTATPNPYPQTKPRHSNLTRTSSFSSNF